MAFKRYLLSFFIFLSLLYLGSCGKKGEEERVLEKTANKVFVLGLDACTWAVMFPMIKEGKLPVFEKLIFSGSYGNLKTFEPTISLLIWTTIATGKTPAKHGFLDWTTDQGRKLALSSNIRQCRAIWNILSEQGRSAIVINWWGTWPSENIKGIVLSDRFQYEGLEKRSFPDSFIYIIDIFPAQPLFRRFFFPEILEDFFGEKTNQGLSSFELPIGIQSDLTTMGNWFYFDRLCAQIALAIQEKYPADLLAVYLRGLDPVEHIFWRFLEPDGFKVSAEEIDKYKAVIPLYYKFYESLTDNFLSKINESGTLFIMSDHGMVSRARYSGKQEQLRVRKPMQGEFVRNFGVHINAPNGIIILLGDDFQRNKELTSATVFDITPTILWLYSLPIAQDMDGKLISEAIKSEALQSKPPFYIPSYESGYSSIMATPIPSLVDDKILEELKTLGYIH